MKRNHKLIAALLGTAALATASLVYAQQGGPGFGPGFGPGGCGGGGMGVAYGMGGPGMQGAGSEEFVARRLSALKAELKITPAQEASWSAFEGTLKQQSTAMQAFRTQMQAQMHGSQADGAKTDFNALRQSMFALRESNQTQRSAALKDLYAALTPEQITIVQQQMNNRSGRGDRGGHRGGHGPWNM